MKYLFLLLLVSCTSATVVQAPADGQHVPVTVQCDKIPDCAQLLEHICQHNHYAIKRLTVFTGKKEYFQIKVVCNP